MSFCCVLLMQRFVYYVFSMHCNIVVEFGQRNSLDVHIAVTQNEIKQNVESNWILIVQYTRYKSEDQIFASHSI